MHHRKLLTALGLGLSAALLSAGAAAAGVSGKTNLVCASIDVVACTKGNCIQGKAQTFEMPTFLFVDVKRKVVHGVDESGEEVASPVKNYQVTEKAIILQGFENDRGWTAGIDRKTGGLTLSLTGADVSFTIFGNCTER